MGGSDRATSLRARVQADPYDQDAWDDLLDELKTQKDVTAVREAYEALLAEFPTAVRVARWTHQGSRDLYMFADLTAMSLSQAQTIHGRPTLGAGPVLEGLCRVRGWPRRKQRRQGGVQPLPAAVPQHRSVAVVPPARPSGAWVGV